MYHLLTQFVGTLVEESHSDLKILYIDGTKVKAVEGRYTFVWRKSAETYNIRLKERMIQEFGLPEGSMLEDAVAKVSQAFQHIRNVCSKGKISFIRVTGCRKTPEQRQYEYDQDVQVKFETY